MYSPPLIISEPYVWGGRAWVSNHGFLQDQNWNQECFAGKPCTWTLETYDWTYLKVLLVFILALKINFKQQLFLTFPSIWPDLGWADPGGRAGPGGPADHTDPPHHTGPTPGLRQRSESYLVLMIYICSSSYERLSYSHFVLLLHTAVLVWLNYKNAYEYWTEQRMALNTEVGKPQTFSLVRMLKAFN